MTIFDIRNSCGRCILACSLLSAISFEKFEHLSQFVLSSPELGEYCAPPIIDFIVNALINMQCITRFTGSSLVWVRTPQPVSSAVQKTSYGIISWPTTTEWCWSWPVDEDYTHGNAERPSSRLGNNMCVRWYASLMSCLKWHHSWYHLGCRCSYCISFPGWDGE